MLTALQLIHQLVSLPGPPGQEAAVRDWINNYLCESGLKPQTDSIGNLYVQFTKEPHPGEGPKIFVMAHMDEIALRISKIEADGKIRVVPSGGTYVWKWGEGPVDIMAFNKMVPAVLSQGCIHTSSKDSVAEYARMHPLSWDHVYLFTGLSTNELERIGVHPGLNVALSQSRRVVTEFQNFFASYALDNRAALAVWILSLIQLYNSDVSALSNVTFVATVSEEVRCLGARYFLNTRIADICVALEIGPKTPEADFLIDSNPTIWTRDVCSAISIEDMNILASCCRELGQKPHWQSLSQGASDASMSAASGFTSRPVTLGMPTENSHGYEIMHCDAPGELARLLQLYLYKASTSLV